MDIVAARTRQKQMQFSLKKRHSHEVEGTPPTRDGKGGKKKCMFFCTFPIIENLPSGKRLILSTFCKDRRDNLIPVRIWVEHCL
jgi:hypothetical protein